MNFLLAAPLKTVKRLLSITRSILFGMGLLNVFLCSLLRLLIKPEIPQQDEASEEQNAIERDPQGKGAMFPHQAEACGHSAASYKKGNGGGNGYRDVADSGRANLGEGRETRREKADGQRRLEKQQRNDPSTPCQPQQHGRHPDGQ